MARAATFSSLGFQVVDPGLVSEMPDAESQWGKTIGTRRKTVSLFYSSVIWI